MVSKRLATDLGTKLQLNIQQVVASNPLSQTRAIVDTAVERTVTGIARDEPPLAAIRAKLGLPVQALWVTRAERSVQIVPVSGEGWTLASYRALEGKVEKVGQGWRVHIVPPAPASLVVPIAIKDGVRSANDQLGLAIWAIDRWGLENLTVSGFSGKNASDVERQAARENAEFAVEALGKKGIGSQAEIIASRSARLRRLEAKAGSRDGVEILIVRPPDEPDHAEKATEPDGT